MRITIGVSVLMMDTMYSDPKNGPAFQGQRAAHGEKIFHPFGYFVTAMGKKPVVSHPNAQAAGDPPQNHGEQKGFPTEYEQRGQSAKMKHHHEEGGDPDYGLHKGFVASEDPRHPHVFPFCLIGW